MIQDGYSSGRFIGGKKWKLGESSLWPSILISRDLDLWLICHIFSFKYSSLKLIKLKIQYFQLF